MKLKCKTGGGPPPLLRPLEKILKKCIRFDNKQKKAFFKATKRLYKRSCLYISLDSSETLSGPLGTPGGPGGPPGGPTVLPRPKGISGYLQQWFSNHFKLLYGTHLSVSPFIASAKCNLTIAQLRTSLTHSNSNIFKTCKIPRLLGLIWAKTKLVFAQISINSLGILQLLKIFEFEWYFTNRFLSNSEKTGKSVQSRRLKIHYIIWKKCKEWVHIS